MRVKSRVHTAGITPSGGEPGFDQGGIPAVDGHIGEDGAQQAGSLAGDYAQDKPANLISV